MSNNIAYDEMVRTIGESYVQLSEMAYEQYKPVAQDLCSRIAPEDETEYTLDRMLDFCGSEKVLDLFKMICRKYIFIYPEMISSEIQAYREMYDNNEDEYNEQIG